MTIKLATITLDRDNNILTLPNERTLNSADKVIIESNEYPELSLTFLTAGGLNLDRRLEFFKSQRAFVKELLEK